MNDKSIYFNTKIKVYPDGTRLATYSDTALFNQLSGFKAFKVDWDKLYKAHIEPYCRLVKGRHCPYDFNASRRGKPCYSDFCPRERSLKLTDNYTLILDYDFENYGLSEKEFEKFSKELNLQKKREERKKKKSQKGSLINMERTVKRAKNKIYDLVALNEWTYFFTGTLGNTPFDPTSAKEALQPLQRWLKDRAYINGLKYVLVAEYQPKSKRIHFHGFINDALEAVDSGTRLVIGIKKPVKLSTLKRNGIDENETQIVYNIPAWKFGFTTAIKAYNGSQACARYIMKYITKENQAVFGRYYWSSRNLTREPDTVYENTDWESLKLKEHTVPNTQINLKYYTFFPGEDDFFYNRSAENSAEILEFLKNCEKLEKDE